MWTRNRSFLLVCFEFNRHNLNRQPWNYVYGFFNALKKCFAKAAVVTNIKSDLGDQFEIFDQVNFFQNGKISKKLRGVIEQENPDVIFWVFGTKTFLRSKAFNAITALVIPIVCSPYYNLTELLSLGLKEFWISFKYLKYFLMSAAIPRFYLKKRIQSYNYRLMIFLSKENKNRFSKIIKSNTIVIPPKIDHAFLSESSQNVNGKLKIGYYGSPISSRGLDMALHALKSIDSWANFDFTILSRFERDELKRDHHRIERLIAKLNFRNEIKTITSELTKSELIEYLRTFQIILLPFKFVIAEVPLVVLESLALNKVVIGTDTIGVKELLHELGGETVRTNNHRHLARKLEEIIKAKKIPINRNQKYMDDRYVDWGKDIEDLLSELRPKIAA